MEEEDSDMSNHLQKYVEKIWLKYDDDNNGYLDKLETKQFVTDTMIEMGNKITFSDNDFNKYFRQID